MFNALIPDALDRPSDDPIFALHGEAKRRAAVGTSVVDATLGALLDDEGRLAVLPVVADAYSRVSLERASGYAPISGLPDFLGAVTRDLLGQDSLAAAAVAVATPGGTGAIHHAVVNFLERGQAVLVPDHHWGPYRAIALHAGRGIEVFEMFGPDLRLNLDALDHALNQQIGTQGRALLVLNDPCNNPTGYSMDEEEWAGVADVVGRAGRKGPVALLLDRAYEKFAPDSTRWLPHLGGLLESTTVLAAWTASKSFAQYGARVGALVALHAEPEQRRRLANALNYSCRATWSNCNHLGMLAVTELLTDPELARRAGEERAGLLALLNARVAAFKEAASAVELPFPRYEGGFFVTVLAADGELTAEVARERDVFVVPIGGGVRVALCATPQRDVPRLVDALREGTAGEA